MDFCKNLQTNIFTFCHFLILRAFYSFFPIISSISLYHINKSPQGDMQHNYFSILELSFATVQCDSRFLSSCLPFGFHSPQIPSEWSHRRKSAQSGDQHGGGDGDDAHLCRHLETHLLPTLECGGVNDAHSYFLAH